MSARYGLQRLAQRVCAFVPPKLWFVWLPDQEKRSFYSRFILQSYGWLLRRSRCSCGVSPATPCLRCPVCSLTADDESARPGLGCWPLTPLTLSNTPGPCLPFRRSFCWLERVHDVMVQGVSSTDEATLGLGPPLLTLSDAPGPSPPLPGSLFTFRDCPSVSICAGADPL